MIGVPLAVAVVPLTVLHLDFNSVRLERRTVEETLEAAAKDGYNAILWEVEDKVRWETCPEVAHSEAFSKDEFRELLAKAKTLGLKPIPLLQTFGHAEYVLEKEPYRRFRELAAEEDCYCVSKPEVRVFLKKWIREHLDLFGDEVADFHLGGDEARVFGSCRTCAKRDRMALYAEHLLDVSQELRARNIRPGIWCDMILASPDPKETAKIPRTFTVWHWDYGYRPSADGASIHDWTKRTETLVKLRFDVVLSASSSCWGDSPFLPNYAFHAANVADCAARCRRDGFRGFCVTSWSVRQGLKGLQRPLWEYAVGTQTWDQVVARHFPGVTPETLADLSDWDLDLTVYDGRDWHKGGLKDSKIAPPDELDRILERLEGQDPDFRRKHLTKAAALEKKIAAALPKVPDDSALSAGARQSLAFLAKIRTVLEDRKNERVPAAVTAAYYAREQSRASAEHSAAVVWSVLANGGNAHRHVLLSQPPVKDLPDLLTATDGTRIATVQDWERKRRGELVDFFERQVYGVRPVERPATLEFRPTEPDKVMMDGRAVRKRIAVHYAAPDGKEGVFNVLAFIPKRATPAPAFVLICNRSPAKNLDPERRARTPFWPVEEIVARGYAAIAFHNSELSSDDAREELEDGVHAVFGPQVRADESWGSFSAWAWGASRVLDWIETEPSLDAAKVAVVGHSRGGKTSLWAGATDTRFALTCVNDSGCGGARLNKVELPLAETFSLIDHVNPHWFCRNHRKWDYRDTELPFDQHELLALIAPRLLAVGSASADWGAGPYGEHLSCVYASPAWELYGQKGLAPSAFPLPDAACSDGSLSYHLRRGGHDLNLHDWNRYMDFAAEHGWK